MRKSIFKKEKILMFVALLVIFSFTNVKITLSVDGCCLNPGAGNPNICYMADPSVADDGLVDGDTICCPDLDPVTDATDYNTFYPGGTYYPADRTECQSSTYFVEDNCEDVSECTNNICCCYLDAGGNNAYTFTLEAKCPNEDNGVPKPSISQSDTNAGSDCATECTVTGVQPTSTSVIINNDATYTNSETVTLTLSATDAATMKVSEGDLTGAIEEPYAASRSFTLSSGDGLKTVYAQFKSSDGLWSDVVLDTITLDTIPPTTIDDVPSGWQSAPFTITLTVAQDAGSPPEATYYTTNGDDPTTSSSSGNTIPITTNGEYTIKYFTIDYAGNPETIQTAQYKAKLDTTQPPPPPPECVSTPPAPTMSKVDIRQGNKGLGLVWEKPTSDLDITSYNIYRKCDSGCSDTLNWFLLSKDVPCSATNCIYMDLDAEWGKYYSYKVSSVYFGVESGLSSLLSNSPGDKDCEGRTANVDFCLDNIAYTGCDWDNVKQVNENCENHDKTCIMDGPNSECRDDALCDDSGYPFALYYTDNTATYNFYDVSKTIVDSCYSCSDIADCYDYKSSKACSADDCSVGRCVWEDYGAGSISDDIKGGVCVDTLKDNCMFCSDENDDALNYEAYNPIFDVCTSEKASLLSTTAYPCNYFTSTKTARSCEQATCYDFDTQAMCDTSGMDLCGFGVCYWDGTSCVKDSDGDSTDDCPDYEPCRKDMNPPVTGIFVSKPILKGNEYLDVEASDAETRVRETYFCIDKDDSCDPNPNEDGCVAGSTIDLLGVGNSVWSSWLCTGNTLQQGTNYIRFYSIDMYSNVESNKSKEFEVDTIPPTLPSDLISTPEAGTDAGTTKLTVTFDFVDEQVKCGFIGSNGLIFDEPIELATCYSDNYVRVFDNLADGSGYTLSVTCEDITGNEVSKNYFFDIDKDPSITIEKPQPPYLYDSQPEIQVMTLGNVLCRYIQDSDIVAYDSMPETNDPYPLVKQTGLQGYLHTLSSYPINIGSNKFNFACKLLEEDRDSVTFTYDPTPPRIVLNDEDGAEVTFDSSLISDIPYKPQIFNLVCTDEPTGGFGCVSYRCIPDTLYGTCDPTLTSPGNTKTLQQTKTICYQAVEETTGKKSDDPSVAGTENYHCGTVRIDNVRPYFTFNLTTGRKDTIPVQGGFTSVTITSGDYNIVINSSEVLPHYPEIDLEGSGYKYQFTSTDCPTFATDKKCSASFTISSDGAFVTLNDNQGTPAPLLQNVPITDGALSITLSGTDTAGNEGSQIHFDTDASSTLTLDLSIDITPPTPPTIDDDYVGTFYISSEAVVIEGTFDAADTDELFLYVNDDGSLDRSSDTEITGATITTNEFKFDILNSEFGSGDGSDGTYYIFVVAEDALGNTDQAVDVPVIVRDTSPPTITDNYPDDKDGYWVNSDQTITLDPQDTGGSGIKEVRYCEGIDCTPVTILAIPYQLPYSTDKDTIVRYQAFDNADNPSTIGEFNVTIDKTPPTIYDDYPDDKDGYWVNSDQTITLDPQDTGGSGIDEVKYCEVMGCDPGGIAGITLSGPPYTLPTYTDSQDKTVRYQTWDNAGNPSSPIGEFNVKIDTMGPEFSNERPPDGTLFGPGTGIVVSVIIVDDDGNLDTDSIKLKIEDTTNSIFIGDNDADTYVDSITKDPCYASRCKIEHSFIPPPGSVATDYEATAEASDGYGNIETTTWSFTVDPNVPGIPDWTSSDFGPGTDDKYYVSVLDPTITVNFDNVNADDRITGLTLNVGANNIETKPLDVDDTYDYEPANDLVDGTEYTLTVTAKKKLPGTTYGIENDYSITLLVDTTKPTSPSIQIEGGALYTDLQDVALTLSATDDDSDIYDMMINETPDGVAEPYRTSKSFTLSSGDEQKTISAKFRNRAGLWSDTVSAAITLDTSKPTISGLASSTHPNENTWYNLDTVTLAWSVSDGTGSGIAGYSYVFDKISDTEPDDVLESGLGTATTITETIIETGYDTWYFHIQAYDNLGIFGDTVHYRLNIDKELPDVSSWTPTGTGSLAPEIAATISEEGSNIVAPTHNNLTVSTTCGASSKTTTVLANEVSYSTTTEIFTYTPSTSLLCLGETQGVVEVSLDLEDNAGNTNTAQHLVTIDKNKPYVTSVQLWKDLTAIDTKQIHNHNSYEEGYKYLVLVFDKEISGVSLSMEWNDQDYTPSCQMDNTNKKYICFVSNFIENTDYLKNGKYEIIDFFGTSTFNIQGDPETITFYIDSTAPASGSVSIDEGDYTKQEDIHLTVSAIENSYGEVVEVIASQYTSFSPSTTICGGASTNSITRTSNTYKCTSVLYTLTGIEEEKTVYVKFINPSGLESIVFDTITLDKTEPTIDDDYPDNKDGFWVNSDQTITLTPVDTGGSEIKEVKYCIGDGCDPSASTSTTLDSPYELPYTTNQNTIVRYQAFDNADNPSFPIGQFNVKIDATPPTITDNYPGGWLNSYEVITLTADDGVGSGIKEVKYCDEGIDGIDCTPNTNLYSQGNDEYNLYFDEDKNTIIRYQAWDNAGNPSQLELGVFNVRIDTRPPVISEPASDSHGDENTWYNSDSVTLRWDTAIDPTPGSGLAGYRYAFNEQAVVAYNEDDSIITDEVDLGAERDELVGWDLDVEDAYEIYYFHIQAYDDAGNYGTAQTYMLKIDTQNPAVTFTPSQGERTNNEFQPITITVDGTGSDVDCSTLTLAVNGGGVTDYVTGCDSDAGSVTLEYTPSQSYLPSGTTITTADVDIYFTIRDRAAITGNQNTTDLLLFVVDTGVPTNPAITLNPALTSTTGSTEAVGTTYDNYYYINNNLNTITFTFDDVIDASSVARVKKVELKSGDGASLDITNDDTDTLDYTFTYDPATALTQGKHTITLTADKKIQLSPALYGPEKTWTYHFIVDSSDPSVNLQVERFDGTSYVLAQKDGDNWLTNDVNIIITGDYTDLPDITNIETLRHVKFDDVGAKLDTFNDEFESVDLVLSTGDAVKTIDMEIQDKAVNSITQQVKVKLDTSGPGLTIDNIDLDGDGTGWYYEPGETRDWQTTFYTKHDAIAIRGSLVKQQSLIDEIIVKGGDNVLTDADDVTWLSNTEFKVIVPTDFTGDLKTYNLTVIVKDKAGEEQESTVISVVKDNVPPTITLSQPLTAATTSQTPTIELYTVEPTTCFMRYYVSEGIKVDPVSFGTTYSTTPTRNIPSAKILRDNFITPITFTCEDRAGHVVTEIIDIHVDNTHPTITNVEVVDGEEVSATYPYNRNYRFYRDSLITRLRATSDEDVRCKYVVDPATVPVSFGFMPNEFIDFDNNDLSVAFKTTSETSNIGLTDDSTYTYYLDCEDKAGNTANNQFVVNLAVDKDIMIGITSLMENYVGTKTPIIKVETDRNARCTIDTNYQGFFGFFRDMFTRPVEMTTLDYLTHQFPQSVLEWEDELDEGLYSFTATCHDQTDSGIDDGSLTFAFIIDVTEPNKPIITSPSQDVKTDFTITGTIDTSNNKDAEYIFLKGNTNVNTLVSNDAFTLVIPADVLELGVNTISVIAKDMAGNEGPESDPIIVNYVITAPQFHSISPESGSTKKEVTEIIVGFTLVNEVPIDFTNSKIGVLKEGVSIVGTTTQVSDTEIKFTPIDLFTNGVYDVLISVYDQLGNGESYVKGFTVDDTAPVSTIDESQTPSHTNNPQINIVGTVVDIDHDITGISINVYDENNNLAIQETLATISDPHSVSINETITLVEDGKYHIVIIAVNNIPVESSSNMIYVTLDRVEPEAEIIIG